MGAVLKLRGLRQRKPYFALSLERENVVPGSPAALCLKKTIGALRTASILPAPGDLDFEIPPVHHGWLRKVEGTDLLLIYGLNKQEDVVLWGVKTQWRMR
ncbi:MAG: hypothetical protein HY744_13000 [Deltaproteobacteria bacterium]|nr:hypothetical protein [Deltaproteobacteria bacterium]